MSQWILVIDDDAGFRECVTEIFRAEGFEAYAVEGGRAALAHLSGLKRMEFPALIILDLRMPDMNGEEFLISAKRDLPELATTSPILLCSASPNTIAPRILGERSAFLRKPASIDEIVQSAQKLIRSSPPYEGRPSPNSIPAPPLQ